MREAGWATRPYHVVVPSFGDWGFLLGATESEPRLAMPEPTPPLRFLDADVLQAATVFPRDRRPMDAKASTLNRPVILDYQRREWRDY